MIPLILNKIIFLFLLNINYICLNIIIMKKSYEDFLKLVKSECKKHNIKLKITKYKSIKLGSFRCSGYFESEENPTLAVAMGHSDNKAVLAHEYCHLTQWLDKIPLWDLAGVSLNKLDAWLEGEEIDNIEKHIAICRDLELDNEKRTVKLIEEYDLGIDVQTYIKKSNAYILFYNWLLITRKWSKPGNSPYMNKKILSLMSDKFDMNYNRLDSHIKKAFEEEKI